MTISVFRSTGVAHALQVFENYKICNKKQPFAKYHPSFKGCSNIFVCCQQNRINPSPRGTDWSRIKPNCKGVSDNITLPQPLYSMLMCALDQLQDFYFTWKYCTEVDIHQHAWFYIQPSETNVLWNSIHICPRACTADLPFIIQTETLKHINLGKAETRLAHFCMTASHPSIRCHWSWHLNSKSTVLRCIDILT